MIAMTASGIFLMSAFICAPESRLNAELENRLNETADIVTKNLAQSFVDLRALRLTAQPVTELRLDHAESCLNVREFVITLQKNLAVEFIVVIHLSPKNVFLFPLLTKCAVWSKSCSHVRVGSDFERNVWHSLMVHDYLQICRRRVRLIRTDFLHHKASASTFNERFEIFCIVRITLRYLNRRDDVCLHAAHKVNL